MFPPDITSKPGLIQKAKSIGKQLAYSKRSKILIILKSANAVVERLENTAPAWAVVIPTLLLLI